jgi:hypothetical protein
MLGQKLERARIAMSGDEFGDGYCTIYMYGPSPEALCGNFGIYRPRQKQGQTLGQLFLSTMRIRMKPTEY